MEEMVFPAIGDVHAIPAADASFDLVISRGSFHSWNRLPAASREIHRVLKPWGIGYIGGGYGSARIRDEVLSDRTGKNHSGDPDHRERISLPKLDLPEITRSVEEAGIGDYRIINDDSGFWIVIRKNDGDDESNLTSGQMVFQNRFFLARMK